MMTHSDAPDNRGENRLADGSAVIDPMHALEEQVPRLPKMFSCGRPHPYSTR